MQDIQFLLFWKKAGHINYAYILKYIYVGRISPLSEMIGCHQIVITRNFYQTFKKTKIYVAGLLSEYLGQRES